MFLLSVYHGKVSRGHHEILRNYPRTEYPENNLIFLKVTQACFSQCSDTSLEALKTIPEEGGDGVSADEASVSRHSSHV